MAREVWKYEVPVAAGYHVVAMPQGARIVHLGVQQDMVIAFWAEVPLGAETIERYFWVRGTGHMISSDGWEYVGSVQMQQFVWHLYEWTGPGVLRPEAD